MAVYYTFYIADRDDGTNSLRRTRMATDPFDDLSDRRLYVHDVGSWKNIPGRNSDARNKDQLQGNGEMVHDERLRQIRVSVTTNLKQPDEAHPVFYLTFVLKN